MNQLTRLALALAILTTSAGASAQERSADPLQGMTQCFQGGEFHAEGTYRMSPSVVSRKVDTADGPLYVSIADGYRLMIYRKSTSPLVNLKIERSIEGQFDTDRAAIMKQMAALAGGGQLQVENSSLNGVDIVAVNKPAMETSGVISMYQLFHRSSSTIATVHVLNQEGPAREFASATDYAVIRDRFIGALSSCIARKSATF
jgi:hypothetical protein